MSSHKLCLFCAMNHSKVWFYLSVQYGYKNKNKSVTALSATVYLQVSKLCPWNHRVIFKILFCTAKSTDLTYGAPLLIPKGLISCAYSEWTSFLMSSMQDNLQIKR